ncbi:MAG: hypothetical protein WKG00_14250 [Polyangiaceae bacterium]
MHHAQPSLPRLASLLFCLSAAGCAIDSGLPGAGDDTATQDVAATESLVAKGPGVTVWVDPRLAPEWRFERPVWVLRGRASKDLEGVLAFQSDDEYGDAQLVSKRKFEVTLDAPLVEGLIAGRRLFVHLDPVSGSQPGYAISVRVTPRLAGFSGSSKVWVGSAIEPVFVGAELLFRSGVSTSASVGSLSVTAEESSKPRVSGGAGDWTVEWNGAGLLLAAQIGADPVWFAAQSGSTTASKAAALEIRASDLGVTTGLAFDTWPEAPCQAAVASCLESMPDPLGDTADCGAAMEVLACDGDHPRPAVPPSVFATDLRRELDQWYGEHQADVADAATMLAAQAAVTARSVTEVTDPEGDPDGHDLDQVVVYSHPDTVFPGSDIVWFGAYDKATGALVGPIYSAN